jgi:hypothetical protein
VKKQTWITVIGVVAVVVLLAAYLASPLLALNGLRGALRTGDRDSLERRVDFPSVRESLKSQLRAELMDSLQSDERLRNNPFAGLAILAAPVFIDRALDAAVTPEGLAAMIQNGRIDRSQPSGDPGATAAAQPPAEQPLRARRLHYANLDTFKAEFGSSAGEQTVTVVLGREGLFGWRVKRIDLPRGLLSNRASSMHRPTAGPAASSREARLAKAAFAPGQDDPPSAVMADSISFAAYPAKSSVRRVVLPDFEGAQRKYRDFRTRVREGFVAGVNFGGHMVLTEIGCGAGCRWVSVGDAATGRLFEFPLGGEDNYLLQLRYRQDSFLVKAIWEGQGEGTVCYGRDLVWTGRQFRTVREYSEPGACPTWN